MSFRLEYFELAFAFSEGSKELFEKMHEQKSTMTKLVKSNNQIRKKLDKICKKALLDGELESISEYLNNDEKYIRYLTAMYFLNVEPIAAIKVLEDILKLPSPNIVKIDAKNVLEVWKKGLYKL